MSDSIDRQAAINAFNTNIDELVVSGKENADAVEQYLNRVIDEIKQLPPIQPVNCSEFPNNSDAISRQAAIDALCNDYCGGHQDCKYYPNCENLRSVQKLPSAQPEIIRCAECKWFQCNMRQDGYLPKGVDEFECRHWCGSCDPTDFCSYAERREVTT